MLTIDQKGAETLLALLSRIRKGHQVTQEAVEEVLAANAFFVDFYSGWDGCSREVIREVILHFDQPEQLPAGMIPSRMAEGFRLAMDQPHFIQTRMAMLEEFDPLHCAEHILAFLPAGTPLDSVIHITVDQINNAFVSQREMGISVLKGMDDPKTFEEAISHELHHVCFRYWAAQDIARQAVIQEHSGRSIAVMHIENLLMEGLANHYCTPGYVYRAFPDELPLDPFQSRLARLQREEMQLFSQAEKILALSLAANASFEVCWEAAKAIAFDMEDFMLPAGHYLGARMVQTMERSLPRPTILSCVQHLSEFLPLYNQAAHQQNAFTFDPSLVEKFKAQFEIAIP